MEKDLWRLTFLEMKNKGLAQNRAEAYSLVLMELQEIDSSIAIEKAYLEASNDFKKFVQHRYKEFLNQQDSEKISYLYRRVHIMTLKVVILASFFEKIQKIKNPGLLIDLHEICHEDLDFIIEEKLITLLKISKEDLESLKNGRVYCDWQHILNLIPIK